MVSHLSRRSIFYFRKFRFSAQFFSTPPGAARCWRDFPRHAGLRGAQKRRLSDGREDGSEAAMYATLAASGFRAISLGLQSERSDPSHPRPSRRPLRRSTSPQGATKSQSRKKNYQKTVTVNSGSHCASRLISRTGNPGNGRR